MHSTLDLIIIEGAQSTGKTTLINALRDKFKNSTIISEVARSVILNENITNEELQNNINNCFEELQYKILLAQHKRESEEVLGEVSQIILDRCVISPLVYSQFYFKGNKELINKIENSKEFQERVRVYRESAIVFLLHPHESIIQDDGMRKESTFKELLEITNIYKHILEKYSIRHCEIVKLEDRVETVNQFLMSSK